MLKNGLPYLIGILACYAVLVAVVALLQDRLLYYFPETTTRNKTVDAAAQLGLVLWPADTGDYYGLVSVAPPAAHQGTVLIWHGNGGSALRRIYYVHALQRLGYQVVLVEYPGYGARPGATGESSCVADALQVARRAEREFGGPLYVWGESLGCGIASAVAANPALQVRGAVMLTPWDSLPDLAQRLYWYLPARWLVRDRYDNVSNLHDFRGPVAVVMAGQDKVIPNAHTMRLYESLPGGKRLWVFDDAGHNTWPMAPTSHWWYEVMAFVSAPGASP